MTGRTSPIASAVPGRIRVRHPLLRRTDRVQEAPGRLGAVDAVPVTESKPAVGTGHFSADPDPGWPASARSPVGGRRSRVFPPPVRPPRPRGGWRRRRGAPQPPAGPPPARAGSAPHARQGNRPPGAWAAASGRQWGPPVGARAATATRSAPAAASSLN
ncbi:hypothetical protein GAY28_37680, partial [Azospirillum brasilense]|nr:hypothetical protein [Azospirillum brasilense]